MNKRMMLLVTLVTAATALGAGRVQQNAERQAVERAMLDYVEALYELKPELIDRGVHPELTKRGFGPTPAGAYRESICGYERHRGPGRAIHSTDTIHPTR